MVVGLSVVIAKENETRKINIFFFQYFESWTGEHGKNYK